MKDVNSGLSVDGCGDRARAAGDQRMVRRAGYRFCHSSAELAYHRLHARYPPHATARPGIAPAQHAVSRVISCILDWRLERAIVREARLITREGFELTSSFSSGRRSQGGRGLADEPDQVPCSPHLSMLTHPNRRIGAAFLHQSLLSNAILIAALVIRSYSVSGRLYGCCKYLRASLTAPWVLSFVCTACRYSFTARSRCPVTSNIFPSAM